MSSPEHVPGDENTQIIPGHGWSQFGSTPPQHGQYTGAYQSYGAYGSGPFDTAQFPSPPARKGTLSARQKAGAGLALVAVALGGGVTGALVANSVNGGQTVIASPVVKGVSNSSSNTIAAVAKAIMPSVVSIEVKTATAGGEGSGVILSADGLILTNNHVVSIGGGGGGTVTVKFSDGKTADAVIKGTDPTTDLAVIQAQGVSGLTPASLGDSDKLQVGDGVLAIGSPLGLEGSVTSGIVSALDRTLTEAPEEQQPQFPWGMGQQQPQSQGNTIGGMIQTDAAINPGNSGGALVNTSGQVVGINTAIATSGSSSGNIGVGFAIPINTAKLVSDQLIKTGKATHAFLGVSVADAVGGASGAVVSSITAGSPAQKAGLQEGDLITKINDKVVDSAEALVGTIRSSRPGDKVTITFTRGGKENTITTALAEQSAG
ncbi:S1C family serine protease [Microbispora hainanensis]|uniref:PDZ domain-containing protein n=1 Tax=Microbispora hainanensis TaxID=568844 RepID=A0A544YLI6_9ACTN|nr:trypsin-like peptidase domain-containing protein [Microbispora hainanensis]TQS17630.1 PDZ domain-containing protein [Microbispora hainanensis]